MTTQYDLEPEGKFVRSVLPWIVAGIALIVYLATLNHWVSIGSLAYVARATDQSWLPELTGSYGYFGPNGPLLFLVTYPLRWLPDAHIPLAMNLFSAVCAALTLALLVRSVTLLPHDRTHDQREREYYDITLSKLRLAWMPPVLAALVCGLQLSFWENATAMSGEMFEGLLFAYIVRCLLEFRASERDSWLLRAVAVFGAAMTGNWFMVALAPGFILSLLWFKGISFFNLRFLGGALLCGLGGLLLYLVLPLVYVMSDGATAGFWQALKSNLASQKNLVMLFSQAFRGNHEMLVMLMLAALTSVLPVALIGIRWASRFGDPSPLGTTLTTGMFHLAHAAMLIACVWVAFDPSFSPRRIGLGTIAALGFLAALSAGYFCGYFLLVFIPLQKRLHHESFWLPLFRRAAQTAIWLLLLLVPAGLIFKNLPLIRLTNGPALRHYASLLAQNLPEHALVLSDDSTKLQLAGIWLAGEGKARNYVFLETQSLVSPEYHQYLARRHPEIWKVPADLKDGQPVPDGYLVNLISQLSERAPVYYLHPSFGYYFEQFYPVPHGLVYELKRYGTNGIAAPALPKADVAGNESFWKEAATVTEALVPFIAAPARGQSTSFRTTLLESLRIPHEASLTAKVLGMFYSHSLNFWGIQRQKAGDLKEAARHFSTALDLNPDNIAAKTNLRLNRDLQAGQTLSVSSLKSFEDEFVNAGKAQNVLRTCGPFDDPTHRFVQAQLFEQGRLLRQAAQEYERVNELVPDYVPAQFLYAQLLVSTRFPEKSLDLIAQIRARPNALEGTGIRNLDLIRVEAVALLTVNQPLEAERLLQEAINRKPQDDAMLDETLAMALQISSMFARHSNALSVVERQLQRRPNDTVALVNQGFLHLQLGNFAQAIPPLTRALEIETNNYTALLDRAIAYLQSGNLADSQSDYERLQKVFPNEFRVYYGLGEIAWRKSDTNAAIRNYELFLANANLNTDEAKGIQERLRNLKGEPPLTNAPPDAAPPASEPPKL